MQLLLLPLLWIASSMVSKAQASSPDRCQGSSFTKPRLFLLSDIANEPDDAQSFVRLMVYANDFRIEGLVATTSVWLNDTTRPDLMLDIIDAYDKALPNLKRHANGYPDAAGLRLLVTSGLPVYGMYGVGEGKDSDGSKLLVRAVDASEEPLYMAVWGGASVLAQALWFVNHTRSPTESQRFVSKLRVYTISDQDNTGVWIRRNWPQLRYIASVHHFNRYAASTWSAMSGDSYYHYPSSADPSIVTLDWVRTHIQSAGPLGSKYPDHEFIMEGDTPSLLYIIPNGLSDPEYPEWGSWGGRYGPVNYGEGHFADSVDTLVDNEGNTYMGPQVTLWRWRTAYQNDFAARMQWCIEPNFAQGNHSPVVILNGDHTRSVIHFIARPGQIIKLDTTGTCHPDGKQLSYKWWQYREPSSNNNNPRRDVDSLELSSHDSSQVEVSIPSAETMRMPGRNRHPEDDKHFHLILEVTDGILVSYRRVIFTVPGIKTPSSWNEGSQQKHDEL